MFVFIMLAALGLGISLYTYVIEQRLKRDVSYKPVCDISDRISCSKPMQSQYASLFYFSNALVGTVFYGLLIALALVEARNLMFIATIGASIVSCVLAYLLYVKIKALCLLCTSLYIINLLLLYLSF